VTGGVTSFAVLGPLKFERAGESLAIPRGRLRTLLALMLQAGGVPLSRDRLIDELWGETPPATAVSALHVHLSKLRALLGELLESGPAGYSLRVGAFELDAWRFDELIGEARSVIGDAPDRAAQLVARALALVRGEPLCDVEIDGGLGQWQRALEEKHLQALLLQTDLRLAAGQAGELIPELEALLAAHPFEERAWAQLMLALNRAGRASEALDAYQRARRLFAAELGLEPGTQLSALQQQILDRDLALTVPAAVTDRPQADGGVSSIPRAPTPLVGRGLELTDLSERLREGQRLISLIGPGGVGKTRLLLELARGQEANFKNGAVFVRLELVTDPTLVTAEIAAALSRRPGAETVGSDGLRRYLEGKELLLVLDNFEQVLDAATVVAELLRDAGGIQVLTSTRTPLRIRGEQLFEVEPLALPATHDEHEISASPAVQLFQRLLLEADPGSRSEEPGRMPGSSANARAAAICVAVDGLPLAIELAAARAGSLGIDAVAEQLGRPLKLGENALRDLPDRQRTLTATLQWSHDLLSAAARAALLCAGAFIGGFTAQGLAAVIESAETAEVLGELVDARLARRVSGGQRYELLPLVQAFASERLAESELAMAILHRHCAYFVALVAPATQALNSGAAPREAASGLAPDQANIRIALIRAIAGADEPSATALALGLRPLWFTGLQREEAEELMDRLLAAFEVPPASELLLLRAGSFVEGFRDGVAERRWTRRLADRAADLGDAEARVIAINNLFSMAINVKDRDEVRRLRPELLGQLTPDAGDTVLGWTNYFLALDAYLEGSFAASFEYAARGAEHAHTIGHDYMYGAALTTRLLAGSARDGWISRDAILEMLASVQQAGVPPLTVFALWFVACYAAGVGSDTATYWLGCAERIRIAIAAELWPEVVVREEAMELLGIRDLDELTQAAPELGHAEGLSEAAAWLEARERDERSPRPQALKFALA